MLVDKQNELMSDLLFTIHQHGGDDVTRKPPIDQRFSDVTSITRTSASVHLMPNSVRSQTENHFPNYRSFDKFSKISLSKHDDWKQ